MLPDKPSQDEQLTLQDHLSFLAEIANNSTLDPREMHEGGSFPISQQLVLTHDLYHSVVEVFRDVPLPTACYGSLPAWEMGRKRRPSQVHIEKSCSLSRPLVSYVDMIKEALTEKPDHRMKLQEIYAWIKEKYPFFKTSTLAWKVRNGSLIPSYCLEFSTPCTVCFQRVPSHYHQTELGQRRFMGSQQRSQDCRRSKNGKGHQTFESFQAR